MAAPSRAQDAADDAEGRALIELQFKPTARAQLAIWLEREDGEFISTIRLTEATALRGIGNRPGASQMNSGFRWPYGRREGVLPVWANRRASAPDAKLFKRVIFQDRRTEGLASRTSEDQSPDNYYCLSFDKSKAEQDALDAVSCATVFNSDKGRFLTQQDVDNGYGEPYEGSPGQGEVMPLSLTSLYPPRHDFQVCNGCRDHADTRRFADHVRDVMPDIDAVTMATPAAGSYQSLLYQLPRTLAAGTYNVCIEANTEGDHNATYSRDRFPTPVTPSDQWDSWAKGYGYPYRGQPSVVYCVSFDYPGAGERSYSVTDATGAVGSWDTFSPEYGVLAEDMDGIEDSPTAAPGSGADRLRAMEGGSRLRLRYQPALMCGDDPPPGAVGPIQISEHGDTLHAHEWAKMRFAAADDNRGVYAYDVRFSVDPIVDEESFMRATPAKQATLEAEALAVPADVPAGEMIDVSFGGLNAETTYYIAVRALDGCASPGEFMVAEYTTPGRQFTTVPWSPCFVATAAYGSPLAQEIGVLRRFRDRYLMSHAVGRGLVDAYYTYGPRAAAFIATDEDLRATVRWLLSPVIAALSLLDD